MFGEIVIARKARRTSGDRAYLRDVNALRMKSERAFRDPAKKLLRDTVEFDEKELLAALRGGNTDAAVRMVQAGVNRNLFAPFAPLTYQTMTAMGGLEAGRIGIMSRLNVAFSPLAEKPQAWASEHAARFVTNISETTRDVLRKTIASAVADNAHPRGTKLVTEIKSIVGLTEPHADAVWNYRGRLLADGMDIDRVASKVERYADRLKRVRAENIARTETAEAIGNGRILAWGEFIDEGHAARGEVTKEWITAADEKVCEICLPLNGQVRGMHEFWFTEDGEIDEVPAHSSCRCDILYHFAR